MHDVAIRGKDEGVKETARMGAQGFQGVRGIGDIRRFGDRGVLAALRIEHMRDRTRHAALGRGSRKLAISCTRACMKLRKKQRKLRPSEWCNLSPRPCYGRSMRLN